MQDPPRSIDTGSWPRQDLAPAKPDISRTRLYRANLWIVWGRGSALQAWFLRDRAEKSKSDSKKFLMWARILVIYILRLWDLTNFLTTGIGYIWVDVAPQAFIALKATLKAVARCTTVSRVVRGDALASYVRHQAYAVSWSHYMV